jgi:hypothetical protein
MWCYVNFINEYNSRNYSSEALNPFCGACFTKIINTASLYGTFSKYWLGPSEDSQTLKDYCLRDFQGQYCNDQAYALGNCVEGGYQAGGNCLDQVCGANATCAAMLSRDDWLYNGYAPILTNYSEVCNKQGTFVIE